MNSVSITSIFFGYSTIWNDLQADVFSSKNDLGIFKKIVYTVYILKREAMRQQLFCCGRL